LNLSMFAWMILRIVNLHGLDNAELRYGRIEQP
jgi:hypothetical protein